MRWSGIWTTGRGVCREKDMYFGGMTECVCEREIGQRGRPRGGKRQPVYLPMYVCVYYLRHGQAVDGPPVLGERGHQHVLSGAPGLM